MLLCFLGWLCNTNGLQIGGYEFCTRKTLFLAWKRNKIYIPIFPWFAYIVAIKSEHCDIRPKAKMEIKSEHCDIRTKAKMEIKSEHWDIRTKTQMEIKSEQYYIRLEIKMEINDD